MEDLGDALRAASDRAAATTRYRATQTILATAAQEEQARQAWDGLAACGVARPQRHPLQLGPFHERLLRVEDGLGRLARNA